MYAQLQKRYKWWQRIIFQRIRASRTATLHIFYENIICWCCIKPFKHVSINDSLTISLIQKKQYKHTTSNHKRTDPRIHSISGKRGLISKNYSFDNGSAAIILYHRHYFSDVDNIQNEKAEWKRMQKLL